MVCLRLGLGSVGLASLLYIIFSPFISRFNIEKYIKNFKENNSVRYNNSSMTIKEAEEILEVSKDASRDEIKQSYYKLMHKIHPDTGGTKYFANKLTEAYKMLINNK
ncbi:MAG: J domain-containing protein [Alphaproteobacteria bacterium]